MELLVVIGIIAVLVALALTAPGMAMRKARVNSRRGGKLNILFCDGRVEALKLEVLFSNPGDEALSLRNRDHQPHRELLP
jgi:prepilin-type processing-associated H-X9-DG protein